MSKPNQSFCQVCRHPTPGHEKWCPVLTGEPQAGDSVTSEFWRQFFQNQGVQNQATQLGEGTLAQLRARK
jgi:hypothetical protein